MNIHFSDKALLENLQMSALCRLEVGSRLYGLQHKDSDTDYLYILPRTALESKSFLVSQHQLQYKDTPNGIDHNFTNLYAFITNCLSGESTINFECLHSAQLLDSPLAFLANHASFFYNYNIIKSYLGLCDRDIRHYSRQPTRKDKASAIIHIRRGFRFAQHIFENKFQLIDNELIDFAKQVRFAFQNHEEQAYEADLPTIQQKVKEFRQNKLNKALESKQLVKEMSPELQCKLDELLYEFVSRDFYQVQQQKITLPHQQKMMNLSYNANENWVIY